MEPYIKIIDNKKISLTQHEWELYQAICRSYDRPNLKGEELFKDLFESDDNGIIVFLKPPASRYTSIEVYLFIAGIMIHQHIRQMHSVSSALNAKLNEKMLELEAKITALTK